MREYDRVLRDHVSMVTRAADFAARRHVAQFPKGSAREPYINHLAEVARLVAESLDEPNAVLVAAAWLHDTIEDTGTTPDEITAEFGRHVCEIVLAVTDDKSLPKEERKQLQVVNTPGKSEDAKLLKLADKISNLRAIAASPPASWDKQRCLTYVGWASDVIASARGLNARLDAAFDEASHAARSAIKHRP